LENMQKFICQLEVKRCQELMMFFMITYMDKFIRESNVTERMLSILRGTVSFLLVNSKNNITSRWLRDLFSCGHPLIQDMIEVQMLSLIGMGTRYFYDSLIYQIWENPKRTLGDSGVTRLPFAVEFLDKYTKNKTKTIEELKEFTGMNKDDSA